jgi:hypothetical protein
MGTKQIYLHHTRPQNLLITAQRTKFIDEFVALMLFLADGRGNVGFMRREPETPIHRNLRPVEGVSGPPQQVLDYDEMANKEYEE